ncbi:MAG TPA: hypothetical protein VFZ65_08795 [Planctomycetota bacterium]|nr:hypothetical protein [Planctomycetota bacterium]
MHNARVTLFALLAAPALAQASWSQLYTAVSPPPQEASMVCFEPTGEVLLLFGRYPGTPPTQGWRLQGSTWSAMPLPVIGLAYVGLTYDSNRQRVVAFGGSSPLNNDVWEWNGAQWTHPNPIVRPTARERFAIAFDRARGVVVVFGGLNAGTYLSDLWEWNGAAWTQRAASTPLGPRAYSLAAFDPVRQDVLVYGGLAPLYNGTLVFNDTWSWDGTAWTHQTPATPPPYDVLGAIVTDLHRQRVILYGGSSGDGLTREWDGSEWTAKPPPSPGPRVLGALAYDTQLRRTVLFGGTSQGNWVPDTWVYQTPLPADVVPFGSGCAGTAGLPSLAAAAFVLPWLGDTMRNVVQSVPAGEPGAIFVSSFGSTSPVPLAAVGMPGCELLVPLDVAEFRAAVAGRAEWTTAIPNTTALAGTTFRQQAFVLDAGANALGLVASNGVVVTLGVR